MKDLSQKMHQRSGTYFFWCMEQFEKFVKRLRPDLIDY